MQGAPSRCRPRPPAQLQPAGQSLPREPAPTLGRRRQTLPHRVSISPADPSTCSLLHGRVAHCLPPTAGKPPARALGALVFWRAAKRVAGRTAASSRQLCPRHNGRTRRLSAVTPSACVSSRPFSVASRPHQKLSCPASVSRGLRRPPASTSPTAVGGQPLGQPSRKSLAS